MERRTPTRAPASTGAGRVRGERFTKQDRVRRRAEFLAFQRTGRRVHTPHFVLVLGPEEEQRRLGITVTKKVCPHAVDRNRIKRLLREAFRRHQSWFPERRATVILGRKGAEALGLAEVLAELERAAPALAAAARKAPRPACAG